MFIFRRISEKDVRLEFITGNKAFDELNSDKTLRTYLEQDILRKGEYLTYLLFELEEQQDISNLLALLRFKYTSIETYIQELRLCNIPENDITTIKLKTKESNLKIVYLSRIGVVKPFQELNISQIVINFFEFLILRNKENVLIYVKVLQNLKKVVGSSYRLIGKNIDVKWGNYYLASRLIKFEHK